MFSFDHLNLNQLHLRQVKWLPIFMNSTIAYDIYLLFPPSLLLAPPMLFVKLPDIESMMSQK